MARWQRSLVLLVFTLLLPIFLAACEPPQEKQNSPSPPASEAMVEETTPSRTAGEPQLPDEKSDAAYPDNSEEVAMDEETVDSPPADTADAVIDIEDEAASNPTLAATTIVSPVGCEYQYFFEPAPEQCPRGEPIISFAAEQIFENGFMVWLEKSGSIYLFYNDQTWEQFEDIFEEGQPEPVPDVVPPLERYVPKRGFGLIWHEHPHIQEKLGWALNPESGFDSIFQEQMVEVGEDSISYLSTSSGQVIALTRLSQDNGDWVFTALIAE